MKQGPLVSVLTPVYNGERFISECVESVLAQTYETWEYIIVNNCSTDRTLEIIQKYAEQDPRIRIHTNQDFVSALRNHNIAFQQMSSDSKYCKLVQGDDVLFPSCLAEMVQVAERYPNVGIVGAYRLDNNRVNLDGLPYPSSVVTGRDICRFHLLGQGYVFGSPTSTLFRSNLVKNKTPFYDESNVHTDTEVCYELLQDVDFGFVHQVLTYTRRRESDRASSSKKLNTYLLGHLLVLKKFGPIYLTKEEYEDRLTRHLEKYYDFLGQEALRSRDKQFWSYHQSGFKQAGLTWKWRKVVQASVKILIEYFLNLLNPRK